MPEAAEVTVAAAQLADVAVGRTLDALPVTHPRTMRATSRRALDTFVGRVVSGVEPIGKWILVSFVGQDSCLGIHLRMSGQLLAAEPDRPHPDGHVHAVLEFSERRRFVDLAERAAAPGTQTTAGVTSASPLRRFADQNGWCDRPTVPAAPPGAAGTGDGRCVVWFRDPRTFGELRALTAVPTAEDIRSDDVTAEVLHARASTRTVGVKPVLLDQARFVAGIGSYLADETLWAARIDPRRPANTLATTAWDRIITNARRIIIDSAAAGGVSLADEGWVDLWGRLGANGTNLAIHGRDRCTRCDTVARRTIIAGRSARWCPTCQPHQRRR